MPATTDTTQRYQLISTDRDDDRAAFAEDVRQGLTAKRKRIPAWYLYDHQGSELFERICEQPEYYLTHAEWQILRDNGDDIVAHMPDGAALVELGAGSAIKTRTLIESILARDKSVHFLPVDVSESALTASAKRLLSALPGLRITAVAAEYDDGLRLVDQQLDGPMCLLWLGSSVGNLPRADAAAFLARLAALLDTDDRLLVGIDMRKDPATIRAAYNDAAGVSAKFNGNMLSRLNRELGANFDPDRFRYRAEYDADAGRVDMVQVSMQSQTVHIDALELDVAFDAGESVHMESSHKYDEDEIDQLARSAGLTCLHRWFDDRRYFSVSLFAPGNGDAREKDR